MAHQIHTHRHTQKEENNNSKWKKKRNRTVKQITKIVANELIKTNEKPVKIQNYSTFECCAHSNTFSCPRP